MRQSLIKDYFSHLFVVFAIVLLAACSGSGDSDEAIKSPDLPKGELQSIKVECVPGILSVGQMANCIAKGTFRQVKEVSDGEFAVVVSEVVITNRVRWASQDPAVASVDKTGKVTGVSGGTVNITATLDGVSGKDSVKVTVAVLQSMTVSCVPDIILVGNTSLCNASGVFDDGNQPPFTQDITDQATWTSSSNTIATVDDQGVVTGKTGGVVTIRATAQGKFGEDDVTVRTLNVSSLAVTPAGTSTKPPFCTQPYKATATFEDSSTADVTANTNTNWTSSVAATTVDNGTGVAIAGPQGTADATVTATFTDAAGNVVSDSAVLNVEDTAVASLCVEAAENADPTVATCNVVADFSKPVGIDVPFLAKLVYDSGSFCPLFASDPRVTWDSTTQAAATVDSNGLATTLADGSTNIVATMAVVPVSGSHPLFVGDDTLVDYEVLPDFACVGFYDAAAGLQESPELPGSQQMLAEGVFQIAGPTCDFSNYTTCTGALNSQTEWTSVEGFWTGTACEALVPLAGTPLAAVAPGAVDSDGVVTPSGAVRLGTTCVLGTHTPTGMTDGGTVLVLPVTNDTLVADAAELCDALSPLFQLGGAGGGAGFPVQLVSAISQILNPALTAAFNDGAIPIDDILDQVLGTLSDSATAQLIGPDGPLLPLIEALDMTYGGVDCVVGGLLDTLLGGGTPDPGAIAVCSPL